MINITSRTLWVRSVAIASTVTFLMLAVLIVGAEKAPDLKNWLKVTFYHHWLGKGALALILFTAISLLARFKSDTANVSRYIFLEACVLALSVCVIAGFFLLHTFGLI